MLNSSIVTTTMGLGLIAVIVERVKDRFDKDKTYVKTVELPQIIEDYKIITTDTCLKNQDKYKEKIQDEIGKGFGEIKDTLNKLLKTTQAVVIFLAKRCESGDEVAELLTATQGECIK